jgi:hypothetical protein
MRAVVMIFLVVVFAVVRENMAGGSLRSGNGAEKY